MEKRLPRPSKSSPWWLLALGASAASCSVFSALLPDTRTPADHARAVEPRCKGFAEGNVANLLSPDSVDSVEPAYSYVQTGNDRRANLRGAKLHVAPLPGLSPESIGRSLECHQVAVILRGAASPDDDPYTLPGRWLDLDVSSDADGFIILPHTDSIDDARLILERARHFAARRAPR